MNNNLSNQQKLIRNFLAVAPKHCDNCGGKYQESDFQVIKTSPVNLVLHLKCHICNNSYMLNVLNPMNGMIGAQRTPINIDLQTEKEIKKFAGQEAVNKNEAIDMFSQLDEQLTQNELEKLLENL
ncbi:MAG TPA: hypothetical protein VJC17_01520 [Candidatus Dojkabacteria bacterium]|nr:hypothetical protein [Candidatus Dojkabacteria bacterium]